MSRNIQRCLILSVVSSLLMLPGLTRPAAARAQAEPQTMQFTYPISTVRTNPCNGEEVALTGEGHIVSRFLIDESGGVHVLDVNHTLGALTGAGLTSLVTYRAQESQTTVINTNGQRPQFELTFSVDETLIARGNVPNFIAHTLVHVTVNANGSPTADVLNMQTHCGG